MQQARASGLRAELHVAGEPARLGAEVELAGYRVVQESLTNTIRYAPGAAATVHVAYRADGGLAVDVLRRRSRRAGREALQPKPGRRSTGLAGLSERGDPPARRGCAWRQALARTAASRCAFLDKPAQ